MKIKIGKPVVPEVIVNPTNTYRFVVDFMHGDADGDEEVIVDVPEDQAMLHRFIEFLDGCAAAYPNGKGGDDGYAHVEGAMFFNEGWDQDEAEEGWDEEEWERIIDMPGHPTLDFPWTEGHWAASFQDWNITYFNENGIEFHVKIKK